jgi:MotA/TolQ/ExbB proton channel family.
MEQQDTLAIISNTLENESIIVNGTLNYWVCGIGLGVTILLIILYYLWVKSKQLLNYIPTIWTSLGILGTFIAIYQTLGVGNTNTLSDVDTLVRNIVPAFTTSIYGIIGAIVTSIIIKLIYASEEKSESDEIEAALIQEERGSKFASQRFINNPTPEVIMFRMCKLLHENNLLIGNILAIQSQQEQGLKSFIASHLQQLDTFYDNLHKTNEHYAKELTDEYLNGIKAIIDSAHSVVDGHIREIISSHTKEINQYFNQELQVLNELSNER